MGCELIVLDFDGTIIDSEWPMFTCVRDAYAEVGLQMTIDVWQTRIGRADNRPWHEELGDLIDDPSVDIVDLATRHRAKKTADTIVEPVREGIAELITAAVAAGQPVAVASSSPRDWVEPHLVRLGLRTAIDVLITRDDVDRGKPWPDLFSLACRTAGANAARSVAIEDSHHGCMAAKAAGLTCVAVPNRVTAKQDFSVADLVVPSAAHIPAPVLGF